MSDTADVLAQCIDAARFIIKIKRVFQAQPFGMGTVAEDLGDEAELIEKCIVIPLETDTIPVDFQGAVHFNDCEVRVRFHSPQVARDRITYELELMP